MARGTSAARHLHSPIKPAKQGCPTPPSGAQFFHRQTTVLLV
jgi:hypothetical protein